MKVSLDYECRLIIDAIFAELKDKEVFTSKDIARLTGGDPKLIGNKIRILVARGVLVHKKSAKYGSYSSGYIPKGYFFTDSFVEWWTRNGAKQVARATDV